MDQRSQSVVSHREIRRGVSPTPQGHRNIHGYQERQQGEAPAAQTHSRHRSHLNHSRFYAIMRVVASGLDRRSLPRGPSPLGWGSLGIPRVFRASTRGRASYSHQKHVAGPRPRAPRPLPRRICIPQSRSANTPTSRAAWRRRLSRVHSETPGVTTTLASSAASTALSPLPHSRRSSMKWRTP